MEKTYLYIQRLSSNKIRIYQSNPILSSECLAKPEGLATLKIPHSIISHLLAFYMSHAVDGIKLLSAHSVSLHVLPLETNSAPDSKHHTVE